VVARVGGDRFVLGGCPAGEQVQGLLALGADFGGEGEHHELGVGGERHYLVGEFELSDEWMLELTLTPDDLSEIEEAQPEAQGARYSEANQQMIDR
jgi:hypothetical protein